MATNSPPLGDPRVPERFWRKIHVTDQGCWHWTASRKGKGYGQVRIGDRIWRSHRAFYELLVGPVPDGLVLDHLCRNRLCQNPAHMEPVTNTENVRRGAAHRRQMAVAA